MPRCLATVTSLRSQPLEYGAAGKSSKLGVTYKVKGKAPVTTEKAPSPVAEKAAVAAEPPKYDIAHRADALFVANNLKLRYFHECSDEHFNEFKRLVVEGMSIDEACAAHSDFGAWMASETERQRTQSPEDARILARLRF
ncbi:hypothetical protein MBLNU13_g11415t2 [Cladosporium sp. NU13]